MGFVEGWEDIIHELTVLMGKQRPVPIKQTGRLFSEVLVKDYG